MGSKVHYKGFKLVDSIDFAKCGNLRGLEANINLVAQLKDNLRLLGTTFSNNDGN